MDPNRYINDRKPRPVNIPESRPANMANRSINPPVPPVNNAASPARKPVQRSSRIGRLCISGKRFFGQILIDHWVIRINGEQKEVPFGRNKLSLDLPAGVYLVTAYTPYLGMHCMRVTADIEIRPGSVTNISYQTVFDIFKNGIMRQSIASS